MSFASTDGLYLHEATTSQSNKPEIIALSASSTFSRNPQSRQSLRTLSNVKRSTLESADNGVTFTFRTEPAGTGYEWTAAQSQHLLNIAARVSKMGYFSLPRCLSLHRTLAVDGIEILIELGEYANSQDPATGETISAFTIKKAYIAEAIDGNPIRLANDVIDVNGDGLEDDNDTLDILYIAEKYLQLNE